MKLILDSYTPDYWRAAGSRFVKYLILDRPRPGGRFSRFQADLPQHALHPCRVNVTGQEDYQGLACLAASDCAELRVAEQQAALRDVQPVSSRAGWDQPQAIAGLQGAGLDRDDDPIAIEVGRILIENGDSGVNRAAVPAGETARTRAQRDVGRILVVCDFNVESLLGAQAARIGCSYADCVTGLRLEIEDLRSDQTAPGDRECSISGIAVARDQGVSQSAAGIGVSTSERTDCSPRSLVLRDKNV